MQLYDVEITASTVSSSTQKSVRTLAGWPHRISLEHKICSLGDMIPRYRDGAGNTIK